jgi:hypothetical protein
MVVERSVMASLAVLAMLAGCVDNASTPRASNDAGTTTTEPSEQVDASSSNEPGHSTADAAMPSQPAPNDAAAPSTGPLPDAASGLDAGEQMPDAATPRASDAGFLGSDASLALGDAGSASTNPDRGADADVAVVISDLRVEEISATRAVVRFTTDIETSCEVRFGFAEDALAQSATDPNMDPENPYAIEHQVPLEDLPPDTVVYFRAAVTTKGERTFLSPVDTFTTLAADDAPVRTNVALIAAGSEVTDRSSNYGGAADDATWGANNAIDGSMSTEWSSNGDGDDAFVTLDLGTERELTGFGFRSRKMSDGSAIITSVTLLLDDATFLGPFDTPDPDTLYVFDFDPPQLTTTVRLDAETTTGGNTGAKEIELYTTP